MTDYSKDYENMFLKVEKKKEIKTNFKDIQDDPNYQLEKEAKQFINNLERW